MEPKQVEPKKVVKGLSLEAIRNGLTAQTKSNLEKFDLIGVYVGTEPKLYYPKAKDEAGKNIKVDGKDLREEKPTGYTYTFVELVSAIPIKVVLKKKIELNILSAYSIRGNGYKINTSLYFLQENGEVLGNE